MASATIHQEKQVTKEFIVEQANELYTHYTSQHFNLTDTDKLNDYRDTIVERYRDLITAYPYIISHMIYNNSYHPKAFYQFLCLYENALRKTPETAHGVLSIDDNCDLHGTYVATVIQETNPRAKKSQLRKIKRIYCNHMREQIAAYKKSLKDKDSKFDEVQAILAKERLEEKRNVLFKLINAHPSLSDDDKNNMCNVFGQESESRVDALITKLKFTSN